MGRISTASDNQNLGVASAIAGLPIVAGDLVCNASFGRVVPFNDAIPSSFNNTTTDGAQTVIANASQESSGYGSTYSYTEHSCELGNKNIVFVFPGNGTNGTTGVNFRIKTPGGFDVTSRTVVGSTTGVDFAKVFRINASRFIVFYIASSSAYYRIYNNDGTPVTSLVTFISGVTSSSTQDYACSALSNGNFLFAYPSPTTTTFAYSIIDSSGATVLAETNLDPGIAYGNGMSVKELSNSNIIFVMRRSTGDQRATIRNQAGATIVSPMVVQTNAAGGSNWSNIVQQAHDPSTGLIFEFSNGNIAIPVTGQNAPYNAIKIYNSSLSTTIGTADFSVSFPSGRTQNTPHLFSIDFTGDKLYFGLWVNSNGISTMQVNSSGIIEVELYGASMLSQDSSANGNSKLKIKYLGNNQVLVNAATDNSTSMSSFFTIYNGITGGTIGSTISTYSLSANQVYMFYSLIHSSGLVIPTTFYSSNINRATYTYSAKSILGVAVESASPAASFRIATKGNFQINQSVGSGISFNNTSATVPGTRGVVVGSSAIFNGIA